MSTHPVPGSDIAYHLVCFDAKARELDDPAGDPASHAILSRLGNSARPVSDVFIACHGWMGDVPAALSQYDAWLGAATQAMEDGERIGQKWPEFEPLIIGLHWPSLPWGAEDVPAATAPRRTLSAEDSDSADDVDTIASAIADTPLARKAIQTVLDEAGNAASSTLTGAMYDAYMTLFDEAGLRVSGVSGRPGSDLDRFDPQELVDAVPGEAAEGRLLGFADDAKNALLAPLRTLSFWKMKDRARSIGEAGARSLLDSIQHAAPEPRIHLMGHSFGCIVVSAMVAGPHAGDTFVKRPVDSLFLAQGALSLWAYADRIPYETDATGYFNRIVTQERVRGPIITTRSIYDKAVGRFYPLGAGVMAQRLLGETYPEYGGVGAFGIQGVTGTLLVVDRTMKPGDTLFEIGARGIYNFDASEVIRNGGGPSGAHSDIAHPEVAHAFWSGVSTAIGIAKLALDADRQKRRLQDSLDLDERKKSVLKGGTLSADDEPLPPPPSAPAPVTSPAPAPSSRWINASFEGHDSHEPLIKDEWYQLAFDVDIEKRSDGLASVGVPANVTTSPHADHVLLTVRLDTDDFDISALIARIRVPREGRGQTKARFDISPNKNGAAILKATILRDGNFIQQMTLTFEVGAAGTGKPKVITMGRSLSDAQVLEPRDVGLKISPGIDGYDCTVWGPVHASAHLTVSREYMENGINRARKALLEVVQQTVGTDPVFQTRIDIPEKASEQALRTLANAGADLMYLLFEGPDAGPDSRAVADFLRKLCGPDAPRLKIQIIASKLPVPWSMVYTGSVKSTDPIDMNCFLGMRHIVEQIPLQPSLSVWDHGIASDKPKLAVGVQLNEDIDKVIAGGYVQSQRAFWQKMPFAVTTRLTAADLMQALGDPAMTDQILYFYCHAISRGLNETGGPDASCLKLSNDTTITLKDLRREAPADLKLAGNPLVFINACESAELSSAFYDGFVPYFMNKGARGVIGTECLTPAYFATEWARRFFIRFLGGQRLGETCLELRREFMVKHHNPLGLLYAVHCDADTCVLPAADIEAVAV